MYFWSFNKLLAGICKIFCQLNSFFLNELNQLVIRVHDESFAVLERGSCRFIHRRISEKYYREKTWNITNDRIKIKTIKYYTSSNLSELRIHINLWFFWMLLIKIIHYLYWKINWMVLYFLNYAYFLLLNFFHLGRIVGSSILNKYLFIQNYD